MQYTRIRVSVTNLDGELLDTLELEVPATTRGVEIRPVGTSMARHGDCDILVTGDLSKQPSVYKQ